MDIKQVMMIKNIDYNFHINSIINIIVLSFIQKTVKFKLL